MKCRVTTLGCETEYGVEKVAVEDDQIGNIKFRELELDSLEDLQRLTEEVDTVEVQESKFGRFDFDVTLICGNLA